MGCLDNAFIHDLHTRATFKVFLFDQPKYI